MRGLNSVERFLCRFRRSELNGIEHFQLSNTHNGMKCLNCALNAERVSKQFLKVSFVASFNYRPSYKGTDGGGLKAEPYADPGTKRDFKRHLPAPFLLMPGGEHVTS